jgi:hypothetical protein
VDRHRFVDADPDPTFRFVADPHPTPSPTHMSENQKNFFNFYSQQCQCGQFIEIFWKKSEGNLRI